MRKTIIYLLLLTLVFQYLGNLGVLAWFQVNKDYIPIRYVKIEIRAEMHCNGQCILMKKIKKMKEAEKTSKNSSLNKIEFISILSEALRIKEPVMRHLIIATPVYNKQYQFVYINKLFLPPKFA